MQQRNITELEMYEALDNIIDTSSTPEDSTCIVGRTNAGRVLKVWIVGITFPPPTGHWVIKSVAAKGERDD